MKRKVALLLRESEAKARLKAQSSSLGRQKQELELKVREARRREEELYGLLFEIKHASLARRREAQAQMVL